MCEHYSSRSSKQFFHNLSLMNLDIVILEFGLDIVILEFGHDVSGCLINENLHTPSIRVKRTVAKMYFFFIVVLNFLLLV